MVVIIRALLCGQVSCLLLCVLRCVVECAGCACGAGQEGGGFWVLRQIAEQKCCAAVVHCVCLRRWCRWWRPGRWRLAAFGCCALTAATRWRWCCRCAVTCIGQPGSATLRGAGDAVSLVALLCAAGGCGERWLCGLLRRSAAARQRQTSGGGAGVLWVLVLMWLLLVLWTLPS